MTQQKKHSLVLEALKNPTMMRDLDVGQWNALLLQGQLLKLSGRLACDAEASGIWDELPPKAQQVLTNARVSVAAQQRKIMWEVNRIRRALVGFDGKVILVKGGGYIAGGLTCAQGRHSVDIDILVARKNIDLVEDYLLKAGYESQILNEYDQHYYRDWAHELPPLTHPDRMVEVDVHHNILQLTNKLSPQIDLMIEAAVPQEDNIFVLAPADMLLHSIVHQFVDGTLKGSLRNLLEQHEMITEFGQSSGFWADFMDRAEQLGLRRPVFYCLRYCQHFFGTSIPQEVLAISAVAGPGPLTLKMMDMAVINSMVPYGEGRSRVLDYLATNGLYLRSHWLRMPPMMLFSHLTRKSLRRLKRA
ncbi:nucleotidyltransferase domain-containing protein [Paremcibacter congregatus]|uniref:Nucleotidyltransferase n=1 Tax=Paremcibacter congregatus TaxID=2043170 RepID=A0A2G4YUQ5_9PROT|nr:nucleotidyltransferase family protein [Paremcibacter congregatus]PHZ86069.1 hypothetical protein CRD36_05205 [Paremcibacter congregatus]QDE27035.1 nucleotidyltransferase family protein [Paremcibacter congregatus]